MTNIKISVIVPVYKVELNHLRECLNSLVNQTMHECEFIVVSDGASNEECSLCKDFARSDPRIHFFKRNHAGVSSTRNFGIAQSNGEYITFVDSDDWINNDTCEIIYNFAKKNNSEAVLWEAALYLNNQPHFQYYSPEDIDLLSRIQINDLIKNIIFTRNSTYNSATLVSCKLFKRQIIAENHIQYPTNLAFSEDRVFNIQALLKSQRISYKKELLYYYRIHHKSTSHKYTPNAFQCYTAFIPYIDKEIAKKNHDAIILERIRCFFVSWETFYMNKNNKNSYFQRMRALKELIHSESICFKISPQQIKAFPWLIQKEIQLFSKGLFFPIYLHGIKAMILNR